MNENVGAPVWNDVDEHDGMIKIHAEKIDKLINFVGELVVLKSVVEQNSSQITSPFIQRIIGEIGKVTLEIQSLSQGLNIITLKDLFSKLKERSRQIMRESGKSAILVMEGESIKVDKKICQSLLVPVLQLMKLAIESGIESGEERKLRNKNEQVQIIVKAYLDSSMLNIEVRDDGCGLDLDEFAGTLVQLGIEQEKRQILEGELLQLLMVPAAKSALLSTSGHPWAQSLIHLMEKIEELGGKLAFKTQVGQGNEFKLSVPLSLAIVDGLIVHSGKDRFIVPLSHIQETVRPRSEEVFHLESKGLVMEVRGEYIPLARLHEMLGSSPTDKAYEESNVIIVSGKNSAIGVVVDDIECQQQIVIKKFGQDLSYVKDFSGCAIMGDGRPCLIIDMSGIVKRKFA